MVENERRSVIVEGIGDSLVEKVFRSQWSLRSSRMISQSLSLLVFDQYFRGHFWQNKTKVGVNVHKSWICRDEFNSSPPHPCPENESVFWTLRLNTRGSGHSSLRGYSKSQKSIEEDFYYRWELPFLQDFRSDRRIKRRESLELGYKVVAVTTIGYGSSST